MTTGASGEGRALEGRSLSVRLVLAALVWLAVLLGVGGVVLSLAFRGAVEEEFGYRLDAILKTIIAATEVAPDGAVSMARPLGDPRFDRVFSGWYWQIVAPDGRRLRSRSLWDSVIAVAPGDETSAVRRIDGPNHERLLVVERDLRFANAAGPVHLLVAGDLAEVSGGVRRFDLLLVLSLGLLGLGMAVAVIVQVRYGLRPLRAMAADLAAVKAGDAPRLAGRYPRELAPLAAAMNGVLDNDADLIERARRHVGNLAHGLKTSLAVIGAELQGAADRKVLREQVEAMRRQIEHHLGRAAAMAGGGRTLGVKTSVESVATGVAGALAKVHAERGLTMDLGIAPGLVFRGSREDLEEIVGNLLENACKWAKRRVRLRARESDGRLHIAIDDDGPGLPADQFADALRRGRRLDEKAPGWGLGLSIAADLVDVNGGRMDLSRSELGGLAVTIVMPGPSPAAASG
ncbi:ATP-binding protein [Reyranella sp.]|uniref:ATP-binding protein n=1 Tax=Reyranella sp. TaxID=1929291 RepID=UPI003BAB2312